MKYNKLPKRILWKYLKSYEFLNEKQKKDWMLPAYNSAS